MSLLLLNVTVMYLLRIKDTHREDTPSSKTEALSKSINVYIWAVGTLNQLFIRGSCTQIKFSER